MKKHRVEHIGHCINKGKKSVPKLLGGGGGGMNHSPVEGAEDGGINGSMLFPSLFP